MTTPIQTPEELVREVLREFGPDIVALATRIRERDEAIRADALKGADVTARADNGQESDKRQDGAVMLSSTARQSESVGASASTSTGPVPPSGRGASTGKGAASPPAAPPPDEAVKAAPEEIDDDLESKMRCIENYSLDRNDERVAWRAALRAERERAEKDEAKCRFAWKRMSCGHPGACMVGDGEDAECDWCASNRFLQDRACTAADARVRAVLDAWHLAECEYALTKLCGCYCCQYIEAHEPALAAELGGGKGDGDA